MPREQAPARVRRRPPASALSDLLGRMVNISTPESFELNDLDEVRREHFPVEAGPIVVVSFQLSIEGVVESEFMNVMSVELARELVSGMGLELEGDAGGETAPATYLISTPTAGSIRPREKSSALITLTVGVVMSTRWSSILETAVASEEIFDSLRDSDLEIIAELARTKLQLRDIYHLNVGDVVDIKQSKDSPIFLNISGRRWFDGRMGIYNKQMAVKIGETESGYPAPRSPPCHHIR